MVVNAQVLGDDMLILAGANIVQVDQFAQETNNRTIADSEGRFHLSVPSADTNIKISHMGYYYDTFRAGDLNGNTVYLGISNEVLPGVDVPGGPKPKPDNTLWFVLAAIAGTFAISKLASNKNKPKTVRP